MKYVKIIELYFTEVFLHLIMFPRLTFVGHTVQLFVDDKNIAFKFFKLHILAGIYIDDLNFWRVNIAENELDNIIKPVN